MMSKALLVVDMQELTVGKNHAKIFDYPVDFLDKVNTAIGNTDADIVIYIRNLMKNNLINKLAPFKCFEGTKEAELVAELKVVSNNVFEKYEGNAFSNTELISFLKKEKITEIEVIGVDGGGCVALTALGALECGFKVTLNTSYIGTVFEKQRDKYYQKLQEKGAVIL